MYAKLVDMCIMEVLNEFLGQLIDLATYTNRM